MGSIRRTSKVVPAGSAGSTWLIADSTWSIAEIMSCPQSKFTEMSAEPRLDVERMLRNPGTARTASSTGIVTSVVMRSAGRSPASRLITTRGNSTCGNNATGKVQVETIPPSTSKASRNRTDRR